MVQANNIKTNKEIKLERVMVQGSNAGGIVVPRKYVGKVDHIYIACLECRFRGEWQFDGIVHYRSLGENAEVRLVELNGTRKYIRFKNDASVTLLPSNVLTYEADDELESVYVNEEEYKDKFV